MPNEPIRFPASQTLLFPSLHCLDCKRPCGAVGHLTHLDWRDPHPATLCPECFAARVEEHGKESECV